MDLKEKLLATDYPNGKRLSVIIAEFYTAIVEPLEKEVAKLNARLASPTKAEKLGKKK